MTIAVSSALKHNESFDELQETIADLKSEIFRLRRVIENLPGSIYWKDVNGVYMGRNTYAMEKMRSVELEHDAPKDAIIGRTDFDIFPLEVAERYRKHDLEVMQSGKELSLEEPVTLPNGDTIIQLSTKKPLYNENGVVVGVIGNTVDITHLKKIESELRSAKQEAEQANQIKTEFMRNMEHDIRTPLGGIWGMANIMFDHEDDAEKRENLSDIALSAKELLNYCNGILDFSKIESGMLTIIDKKFNLHQLITNAIAIEMPAAKQKKLNLSYSFADDLPEVVTGDQYRLYRIIINLLSNAVKFTERGSITFNVELIAKSGRDVLIRFIIEDTGIGIPEDKKDYVFEKFSRLTLSNKGLYKGIGLGLRIVKQFMFEMDGEIDVLSKVSDGTKFVCTIPFRLPLTNDYVDGEK